MTSWPPTIDLSDAPGARAAWQRPTWVVAAWLVCEILIVRNSLQPSSRLRIAVLRAFGARVGHGVIMRPGVRIKFPWKLTVGDRSWIGEDVWIHNQDQLTIGSDVVVSQGSFITTGTHAHRDDMALLTRSIDVDDGVWITSRCVVLAGSSIGRSALILPNTVVRGEVPPNAIWGSPASQVVGQRFPDPETRRSSTQLL